MHVWAVRIGCAGQAGRAGQATPLQVLQAAPLRSARGCAGSAGSACTIQCKHQLTGPAFTASPSINNRPIALVTCCAVHRATGPCASTAAVAAASSRPRPGAVSCLLGSADRQTSSSAATASHCCTASDLACAAEFLTSCVGTVQRAAQELAQEQPRSSTEALATATHG